MLFSHPSVLLCLQEMERIPFFMTKSPDSIDPDKDAALTALQQLKYETTTPEGRAMAHKEEGNEHFKKKKYKLAVEEYSAGIKEKCSDVGLSAVLYCNRAAAQFHLGKRSKKMEFRIDYSQC